MTAQYQVQYLSSVMSVRRRDRIAPSVPAQAVVSVGLILVGFAAVLYVSGVSLADALNFEAPVTTLSQIGAAVSKTLHRVLYSLAR